MALSREEMKARLNLGAKAPREDKRPDMTLLTRKAIGTVDTSRPSTPNALEINEWTQRRGQEIANKIGKGKYGYAKHDSKESIAIDAADFFDACFNASPKPVDNCSDPYKAEFIKELLDSTTHRALRASTELSNAETEIAAIKIYESFQKSKDRGRSTGAAAEDAAEDASEELDELEGATIALGMGYGAKSKDRKIDT